MLFSSLSLVCISLMGLLYLCFLRKLALNKVPAISLQESKTLPLQYLLSFPEGRRGRPWADPALHSWGSSMGNTWEGEELHCLCLSHKLVCTIWALVMENAGCWLKLCRAQQTEIGKYHRGEGEHGPTHPFLQQLHKLLGNQFLLMRAFRKRQFHSSHTLKLLFIEL